AETPAAGQLSPARYSRRSALREARAAPLLFFFTRLTAMNAASDRYVEQLAALLRDFTQDWDSASDEPITRETRLFADLGFESIDIIQLVVAIQEEVVKRNVAFDTLMMKDGRYVDDLSVGQIADHLAQQVG